MDQKRFQDACSKIIGIDRSLKGIGTLGEKTIHAVLKYYLEPDDTKHEIKVDSYYADILNEKGIIEIQTRSFNKLRNKLKVFLEHYKVTIVYPVPHHKWINWIDEETGEISQKRKSPKTGRMYMVFPELYKIKEYLLHPNLSIHIIGIDMEEYRLLNGWSHDKKRGSTRYDRIPIKLAEEHVIEGTISYRQFLPETMPDTFTTKDYRKEIKESQTKAQVGLHLLNYANVIQQIGKQGRLYLYERVKM